MEDQITSQILSNHGREVVGSNGNVKTGSVTLDVKVRVKKNGQSVDRVSKGQS